MAKIVITKNRDEPTPTLFLDIEGKWHSVSNKQEFKKIAEKVKMEHDSTIIVDLIEKNDLKEEDNVRINPEFTPYEYLDFIGY